MTTSSRDATVAIFRQIRVPIVAGGALAFVLGALLGIVNNGELLWPRVILTYLVVLFGDLSTHYSNNIYDMDVDKLALQKKTFGGANLLLRYPELRHLSKVLAISLSGVSITLAILLVLLYSMPYWFVLIAGAANLLGWFYSMPPIRLVARGFGEAAIAFGTGLIIPGVGYLAVIGRFDALYWLFAAPFLAYGFILSLSLELPDLEDDLTSGKKTLVTRKGRRIILHVIMSLACFATVIFLIIACSVIVIGAIDFRAITTFSITPLIPTVVEIWRIPLNRRDANHACTANILGLFSFNILMCLYLLILAFF